MAMGMQSGRRVKICGLLLAAMTVLPAQAATTCRALVEISGTAYLVDRSGQRLHRYEMPVARQDRSTTALSPDGGKIAYQAETGSRDDKVVIVDRRGQVRQIDLRFAEADDDSRWPLMELRWDDDELLQFARHVHPRAGLFQYWSVPSHGEPRRRFAAGERSVGVYCNREPGGAREACMYSNGITVDGDPVYSRSGWDNHEPEESLSIVPGASAVMRVEPFLTIAVTGIEPRIRLDIQLKDGSRQQLAIAAGNVDDLCAGGACYGLKPQRVRDRVRIDVLKSDVMGGSEIIDAVVAWRRPAQLAIVENTRSNKRLTLLQPGNPASVPDWRRVAIGALPIPADDEVSELRFIAPEVAYLRTRQQASLVSVAVHGTAQSVNRVSVKQIAALPLSIGVKFQAGEPPVPATVLDWACNAS